MQQNTGRSIFIRPLLCEFLRFFKKNHIAWGLRKTLTGNHNFYIEEHRAFPKNTILIIQNAGYYCEKQKSGNKNHHKPKGIGTTIPRRTKAVSFMLVLHKQRGTRIGSK